MLLIASYFLLDLLNVHLIDGVSGHVIFTAHHRQCSGPVHVIQSENWIIVSPTPFNAYCSFMLFP